MVDVLQSRVLLQPGDFDASVEFYEDSLGLARYRDWGEPPHRGVVYFLGGGYLELTEVVRGPPRSHDVQLWLQVADVDAATRELAAAGVPIDERPERKPWGLIEARVNDPDGLPLVLVEIPVTHPLRRRLPGT